MTEEVYTPTFSHQSSTAAHEFAAPAPKAPPYLPAQGALGDLMQRIESVLVDSPETERAEARAARADVLKAVWGTLPDNARAQRAELHQRIRSPRLLIAAEAWTFESPNLLVLGDTGSGKTSALALIVRRLLEEAVTSPRDFTPAERKLWRGCTSTFELAGLIRWQGCRELSRVVREYPLGHGAPEAIARCQNARLLILDDVGATDDASALERVLNARYERGWPTLTTSGLTSRELSTTFGEALVRRMLQRRGQNGTVLSLFPQVKP